MSRDIIDAVRDVCLRLPEAEEFLSHGAPTFKVRGKCFANFLVNHHGDGRIALWLSAPAGAQEQLVRDEPQQFFVPPYVGPRGWLGVNLDLGLSWTRIAALVREAYCKVAPSRLQAQLSDVPLAVDPPTQTRATTPLDPLQSAVGQERLAGFRALCSDWPEVNETRQFGSPVWQAGKRSFAYLYSGYERDGRLYFAFWVGVDRQGLLCADSRYQIPKYMGHNGWIALEVSRHCDWDEVGALARESYRHFALKRMLARLDGD